MSHDRKPGRVKVLKPGAAKAAGKRRGDGPVVIIDAAQAAKARKTARRSTLVLVTLFLLAAIGCGATTEFYLPS